MCAAPGLVRSESSASWRGVETCGSVWACPVCSAVIRRRRQDASILAARELSARPGAQVHLVTLTMRHGAHDSTSTALNALYSAWRSFRSCERRAFDALGSEQCPTAWLRGTEVTYGANGPHPHFHLVVISTASTDQVDKVFRGGWGRALRKHGRDCSDHGVDVRAVPSDVAVAYALKSFVFEATRSDLKSTVGDWADVGPVQSGVHPFMLDDARLWHDYVAATHGRRCTTSNTVWSSVDPLALESDDRVLLDDAAEQVELVGHVSAAGLRHLNRHPDVLAAVMAAAVDATFVEVAAICATVGVDFYPSAQDVHSAVREAGRSPVDSS